MEYIYIRSLVWLFETAYMHACHGVLCNVQCAISSARFQGVTPALVYTIYVMNNKLNSLDRAACCGLQHHGFNRPHHGNNLSHRDKEIISILVSTI